MPKKFLTIFSLIFILAACEKEEELYPIQTPSAKTFTQTISMGENYENQVYFEFSTQRMASNAHDKWGLGFSTTTAQIILNGGKNSNMAITIIPDGDFASTTTLPANPEWRFDDPSGNIDSNAIGDWSMFTGAYFVPKQNNLYILDRGDDNLGDKRYVKFKLLNRYASNYEFLWNYLPSTQIRSKTTIDITNHKDRNYLYYCFNQPPDTNFITFIENEALPNDQWDIVFTTYKKSIPDGNGKNLPYLLRGVLLNPKNVKAVDVSNLTNYDAIDLAFAKKQTYTNRLDVIGYDWKIWSLSANKYTIDPKKVYIIIDHKGNYYKLKFVDFYDDQGRKGYPKMAWEILD